VPYLLLADDHTYRCRHWDQLVERLVWAHQNGYRTAKERRTAWESDRPLIRSEATALVDAATRVALANADMRHRGTGYLGERTPIAVCSSPRNTRYWPRICGDGRRGPGPSSATA
jgi:hypothetical protein